MRQKLDLFSYRRFASQRHLRATWKSSQLAAARRVALKMGGGRVARRLRIDLDMHPLNASPARTALKNSQLTCGERHAYFGDRTLTARRLSKRSGCAGHRITVSHTCGR